MRMSYMWAGEKGREERDSVWGEWGAREREEEEEGERRRIRERSRSRLALDKFSISLTLRQLLLSEKKNQLVIVLESCDHRYLGPATSL